MQSYRISKLAPDWAWKGFHVHVDGIELALRPGEMGAVVIKPVFSSTRSSAFHTAAAKMQAVLGDPAARQHLLREAIRAGLPSDFADRTGDCQGWRVEFPYPRD